VVGKQGRKASKTKKKMYRPEPRIERDLLHSTYMPRVNTVNPKRESYCDFVRQGYCSRYVFFLLKFIS
jgi:hypothetical protein